MTDVPEKNTVLVTTAVANLAKCELSQLHIVSGLLGLDKNLTQTVVRH